MNAIPALLVCALPLSPAPAAAQDAPLPARRPVVVGYVFARSGALVPGEIAADRAARLTHVNYAFAELREGRIVDDAAVGTSLAVLAGLRRDRPGLRVLASIGGWLGSGGFSDMALTSSGRRVFVESACAFVRRHDLDGLDLDWEYPGLPGNRNRHRPEDRASFTALLQELRQAFDRDGAARGRRLLLTIAAGAFPDYLAHVEMAKVQASLDLVNLMSYDFRVAEGGDEAGHHANLRTHPSDPRQISAARAVADFLAAGVPASKLVLGVPFYGRAWRDVKAGGLYRQGKPARGVDVSSYPALEALAASRGWTRQWDDAAEAPGLWNAQRGLFVSYEDARSLRLKARFVLDQGLAGVMFWEYHADPEGVLLQAVVEGLRGAER